MTVSDANQNTVQAPEQAFVLDFPVHLISQEEAISFCENTIASDETAQVVTINPEMLMQGRDNEKLGKILKSAELVIPDGTGIVWALKRKGHSIDRLPGIELADALLKKAGELDWNVGIIGATAQVLRDTIPKLEKKHAGLHINYAHHGYFTEQEAHNVASACAEKKPVLILVALGVPRQEIWINEHRHLFKGAVFMGIGGSLDVWSGHKKRAPELMRKLHLEWLYRMATEPKRLKRILKTLPLFVIKIFLSDN